MRSKVWWPGIDSDMERRCKTCHGCQLVSTPCVPEPLTKTRFPERPWQTLAADLLGPLPSGHYLLVLVDYFNRFVELSIMKSVMSILVIRELEKIFVVHGNPEMLKTDNGPQFISNEFSKFFQENDIFHLASTPSCPQANGEVERQNRSLLKAIKIAQVEKKDQKRELLKFLLACRSTPHSTTGVSPAKLLFGREIQTKLPELREEDARPSVVEDRDCAMKQKGADYANLRRRAQKSDRESGDKVQVKRKKVGKLSPTFLEVPMEVVEKRGGDVTLESSSGIELRRNTDSITHLKKFVSEPSEVEEIVQGYENQEPEAISRQGNNDCDKNISSRPQRECRSPERFKDYACSYISL